MVAGVDVDGRPASGVSVKASATTSPEHAHGAGSILNAHVRLYLVRHAHSDPGQPDELRPLSTKGRKQARALAEQLAEARPELVL